MQSAKFAEAVALVSHRQAATSQTQAKKTTKNEEKLIKKLYALEPKPNLKIRCRGGFRGGGGRMPAPFSGIRPAADPKGPPCTILRYPFLVTDPKNFPKAPTYTNFNGGERAKKTQFFGQKFPKSA